MIFCLIAGAGYSASAQIYIKVRPVVPVRVRPVAPGPQAIWVGEEWKPNGKAYVYAGGYWASPPHPGFIWIPGHWKRHPEYGEYWIAGHWKRA